MAKDTKIEWAHDTVNPWWGCTKISPACTHCYAEKLDARLHPAATPLDEPAKAKHWGSGPRWLRVDAALKDVRASIRLAQRTGEVRRVFIASMADIFEDRPDLVEPRRRFLGELAAMPGAEHIRPLILTKRPHIMAEYADTFGWPETWWAGTTVEDQKRADERIPWLLKVPATVRFLSVEPLLEAVNLSHVYVYGNGAAISVNPLTGARNNGQGMTLFAGGPSVYPRLDWIIVGGESGAHARPMHLEWVRLLRDQARAAKVPYYFKQWGEWAPGPVSGVIRIGKKAAGRLLDGVEWSEVPNV